VYQNKPLGTGDAVLQTKNLIKDKFFLMLLPDDLIIKKNVSRWGIFKVKKKINKDNFLIEDVIEKPTISKAPSNRAVIGRYILPKSIFSKLINQTKSKDGEIHITDAIRSLIKDKNKFIGHIFSGKYLDCGTMSGYIKASMEISKK
jgi:UTP--glucose-1-phosphate uridylyltransferase